MLSFGDGEKLLRCTIDRFFCSLSFGMVGSVSLLCLAGDSPPSPQSKLMIQASKQTTHAHTPWSPSHTLCSSLSLCVSLVFHFLLCSAQTIAILRSSCQTTTPSNTRATTVMARAREMTRASLWSLRSWTRRQTRCSSTLLCMRAGRCGMWRMCTFAC